MANRYEIHQCHWLAGESLARQSHKEIKEIRKSPALLTIQAPSSSTTFLCSYTRRSR